MNYVYHVLAHWSVFIPTPDNFIENCTRNNIQLGLYVRIRKVRVEYMYARSIVYIYMNEIIVVKLHYAVPQRQVYMHVRVISYHAASSTPPIYLCHLAWQKARCIVLRK